MVDTASCAEDHLPGYVCGLLQMGRGQAALGSNCIAQRGSQGHGTLFSEYCGDHTVARLNGARLDVAPPGVDVESFASVFREWPQGPPHVCDAINRPTN